MIDEDRPRIVPPRTSLDAATEGKIVEADAMAAASINPKAEMRLLAEAAELKGDTVRADRLAAACDRPGYARRCMAVVAEENGNLRRAAALREQARK